MTSIAIPDYVKQLAPQVDNTDFGEMTGFPTIAMSQSQRDFKVRVGDDESRVPSPLNVVILGISPAGKARGRAWYEDVYAEGSTAPPDCSSRDGVAPDQGESRQSDKCVTCDKAAFGSCPSGRGGQACKEHKTMFVSMTDQGAGPFTNVSKQVFQIRVAVMSLKPLATYGHDLSTYNVHKSAAVTQLSYESGKDYPQLKFDLVGFLSEDSGRKAIARSESPEIKTLIAKPPAMLEAPAAAVEQPAQVTQTEPEPPPETTPASVAYVEPETETVAPQDDVVLDAAGMPWDDRIHASTKTKVTDGTWKKKRGVDPATFARVTAELLSGTAPPAETTKPEQTQAPSEPSTNLEDVVGKWL